MKTSSKLLVCLLLLSTLFALLTLSACGGNEPTADPTPGTSTTAKKEPEPEPQQEPDPSLLNFEGLTFPALTVNYSGEEQTVLVVGTLPEGANVVYTDNAATMPGTYNAKAVITCEGYNSKTLTATLTINPLTFTGITFDRKTVDYNGSEQVLQITGTLPEGANVVYTDNAATMPGTHNAKATISATGYTTLELTATLTINPLTFTGITFDGKTVDYNGNEQVLQIAGTLPEGANVVYTDNAATMPGTHNAKATISATGYTTLELTATLTINPLTFTGITFAGNETVYNSEEHVLQITGSAPAGASVVYSGNKGTDVGTYNAKVTLTATGYTTLELTATLKITPATITGVTLSDDSFEYDTFEHALTTVGPIPAGSTVKYYYDSQEATGMTSPGTYAVKAVITNKNYYSLELTATMKITGTEEQLYSAVVGNTVYFQNNLEDNVLYSYKNSALSRVSRDVPEGIIVNGSTMYYISKALLTSAVCAFDGETKTALVSTNIKSPAVAIATDGTYLYYAQNGLLGGEENGIYRYKLDGTAAPAKVTGDKAKELVYYSGTLYYVNASDGQTLYKISASATNGSGTKIWGEKVAYLIEDNGVLYFNSTKTVAGVVGYAAAVYKYTVSSAKAVKLSTDAGKYLTKVGDYLYYVNNDKITSTLFGDGIYKVSANATSDSSLPGTRVLSVDGGNGYSSLSSDGTYIYYYKLNDKHFYRNTADGQNETDLMAGFTPAKDPLAGYSFLSEHDGELYYVSPTDQALYKYNPTTNSRSKVLAETVAGVWFNGDNMYYSAYSLTNYALYRMDLKTQDVVKVCSKRCDNLIFSGSDIYLVTVGSAYNNYICKVTNNDFENMTKIYGSTPSKTLYVADFVKDGGYLYFVNNTALNQKLYRVKVDGTGEENIGSIKNVRVFTVSNGKIYYCSGGTLYMCDTSGANNVELLKNVEINDMIVNGTTLYFSSTSTAYTGLYSYNLSTKPTSATRISTTNASGLHIYNGKVYFIQSAMTFVSDYPVYTTGSADNDGHLYVIDGSTIKKIG